MSLLKTVWITVGVLALLLVLKSLYRRRKRIRSRRAVKQRPLTRVFYSRGNRKVYENGKLVSVEPFKRRIK